MRQWYACKAAHLRKCCGFAAQVPKENALITEVVRARSQIGAPGAIANLIGDPCRRASFANALAYLYLLLGRHFVSVLAQNATALHRATVLALGDAVCTGAFVFFHLEDGATCYGVVGVLVTTAARKLTLAVCLACGCSLFGVGAAIGHIATALAALTTVVFVVALFVHILAMPLLARSRLGGSESTQTQRGSGHGNLQGAQYGVLHCVHPFVM